MKLLPSEAEAIGLLRDLIRAFFSEYLHLIERDAAALRGRAGAGARRERGGDRAGALEEHETICRGKIAAAIVDPYRRALLCRSSETFLAFTRQSATTPA